MRNAEIKYRQAQEDHLKAQHKTREEEANLVGKSVPIAKVNKRQRQEEEALGKIFTEKFAKFREAKSAKRSFAS